MIIRWTFAHNQVRRNTALRFCVSQTTVMRIVREVLAMLQKLHSIYVTQPDGDWLDPGIELNPEMNGRKIAIFGDEGVTA